MNLVVQEAVASVPAYRDILSTFGALINFVRDSPKRLLWYKGLQRDETTALRPFCPTLWVLRESALKSSSMLQSQEVGRIVKLRITIWMFFEEVSCDKSKAGAKAAGFATQLGSFQTYFNLTSMDKIFTPTGTVNLHLQQTCELLQNLKRYAASTQGSICRILYLKALLWDLSSFHCILLRWAHSFLHSDLYADDTQLFISFQATKFSDNISCL